VTVSRASLTRLLLSPAVFRNEDERRIITQYLQGPPGIFVEVGAHEPIAYSQTYHLEQSGWSGILIEPVREYAEALRQQRRARVFEVACGPPARHGQMMPILVAGALSTLRRTALPPDIAAAETRDVPVVTLDSVIAQAGLEAIDFLSIDVEGLELEVLQGFSFDRFRPHLILIEDFGENTAKHRFMRKRGYKRVRRTGNNSWYVPRELAFPLSLFGRWQLLRKYYLAVPFRLLRDSLHKLRWAVETSSR
jgi:FkbM family methyltransferase